MHVTDCSRRQPALQLIRSHSTPRIAENFHQFLLSLYDSLAAAANPTELASAAKPGAMSSGRLVTCSFAEQPGDDRFEVPARQIDLGNRPVATDQDIGRDIRDSVSFGEVAIS